jgi:prepilin-type N-terminal cleavage/methylation domain-containing protein
MKRLSLTCIDMKIPRRKNAALQRGFTLIELLVVIAIVSIMAGMGVLSLKGISSRESTSSAAVQIAGMIQDARSYAMANNTHVYMGLTEVDLNGAESGVLTPAEGNIGGRVVMVLLASKNGSFAYDKSAPRELGVDSLMALTPLKVLDGVHLADLSHYPPPVEGRMARRQVVKPAYHLGNPESESRIPFSWPLSGGRATYRFDRVLQFDPQGSVSMVLESIGKAVDVFEVGLQKTRGNLVPELPEKEGSGDLAALQIEGISGATQIFRP